MSDYIKGKSIIITGAASGFGKLISEKAAALGAKVTCCDVNLDALNESVSEIKASGGDVQAQKADVTNIDDMNALAAAAVDAYGKIDVMINNAGVMPLAYIADHKDAMSHWNRCIDINFKGVLNGIVAVYDQMMSQDHGHIINLSSIYGNHALEGAAVYQATKTAVNFLSDSLRVEARGKIKVTVVKPTGVPGTGLGASVVNPAAFDAIYGRNAQGYVAKMTELMTGKGDPAMVDPNSPEYCVLEPNFIVDQILHAINQPPGVCIGDITIRATGDGYII